MVSIRMKAPRRRVALIAAGIAGAAVAATIAVVPAGAAGGGSSPNSNRPIHARDDAYPARAGRTTQIHAPRGVLANDSGQPRTIVAHTEPANGSLTLGADGGFSYTPAAGFHGTDTFTYTVSDAVQAFSMTLPPLTTVNGVSLTAAAFGSAVTRVPGTADQFFGLEDRGPNGTASDGSIVLPVPNYDPAIARFKLIGDKAVVSQQIKLRDAHGNPYSGRVNTSNPTGETAEDLAGNILPEDPNGYDPEGIVALRDGTFWVSDEYGPFITHFDRTGRQIGRLSPLDGTLPAELVNRMPNRGMEGLTITPDGSTLVGMMQSALRQPDIGTTKPTAIAPTRIVTYNLRTHAVHEYLYMLDDPRTNVTANSEITALSDTTFIVDERDGNFPPTAYKKLWKVDISQATDVGPAETVPGAVYDGVHGGLLLGGKTIEGTVGPQGTATATATLAADGITVGTKSLAVDLGGLLGSLNSAGAFFSHDKIEGVTVLDGGRKLLISNDSDFGLGGVSTGPAPYTILPKIVPATGQQDNGEYLIVDLTKLPAATSTATVTITVR